MACVKTSQAVKHTLRCVATGVIYQSFSVMPQTLGNILDIFSFSTKCLSRLHLYYVSHVVLLASSHLVSFVKFAQILNIKVSPNVFFVIRL